MESQVNLPLEGKKVVLTRSQEQQSEAIKLFKLNGAKVFDLPSLVIGPPDDWSPLDEALSDIETFHWLIFSSANGVFAVEERLKRNNISLPELPNALKIAAVGKKTANCLERLGVTPDFVPPNFVAESLVNHFPVSVLDLKFLIPRVQTGGRTYLSEALVKAGAKIIEVAAYESSCPLSMPELTAQALLNNEVDAIVFTSGKTVSHSVQLLDQRFGNHWRKLTNGMKIISIGPQTSLSCYKYFNRIDGEAKIHDLSGLVDACIDSLKN